MEIQERSGLLVERFSWKLETTEEVYAGSDQFEQLRADFIETRKSRSREIELEMRMIEAYFSGKRFAHRFPLPSFLTHRTAEGSFVGL